MLTFRVLGNLLTLVFLLSSITVVVGQNACKEIKATAVVTHQTNEKGEIQIDFNEQSPNQFDLYLVGPQAYFKKDIQSNVISDLKKGTYTLVFMGRSEKNNFCQKHLELSIK